VRVYVRKRCRPGQRHTCQPGGPDHPHHQTPRSEPIRTHLNQLPSRSSAVTLTALIYFKQPIEMRPKEAKPMKKNSAPAPGKLIRCLEWDRATSPASREAQSTASDAHEWRFGTSASRKTASSDEAGPKAAEPMVSAFLEFRATRRFLNLGSADSYDLRARGYGRNSH